MLPNNVIVTIACTLLKFVSGGYFVSAVVCILIAGWNNLTLSLYFVIESISIWVMYCAVTVLLKITLKRTDKSPSNIKLKINKHNNSNRSHLTDKMESETNTNIMRAKAARNSSHVAHLGCCFGLCKIDLHRFWRLQAVFSAITFWGSIATILILPNKYFQFETIAILLFVLITCWYNPTFYSMSARKITSNNCTRSKVMKLLYQISGYLIGLIQLIVVIWYFFDCDSFNMNLTLNSSMQGTTGSWDNSTAFYSTAFYSTTFYNPTTYNPTIRS